MERPASKSAQHVAAQPSGMRGSSMSRRLNFFQRFSSKKSGSSSKEEGGGAVLMLPGTDMSAGVWFGAVFDVVVCSLLQDGMMVLLFLMAYSIDMTSMLVTLTP